MKKILFITMIAFATGLNAQKKVFLDKEHSFCKENDAVEYAVVTKTDDGNKVEFHRLDGTLKGIGYYSKFGKTAQKRVRDGLSTLKYASGQDSVTYHYVNNRLEGEKTIYYPEGQVRQKASYKNNILDGKLTQYYPDGKLRREEYYTKNKCEKGKLIDKDGNELPFQPHFVMPEFPGGVDSLTAVISKYLKYPPKAYKSREQGRVIVRFVVDKDGRMVDAKVVKSQNMTLEKPALQIIEAMGVMYRWTPGKVEGKPVRVSYTIPIKFRLNN